MNNSVKKYCKTDSKVVFVIKWVSYSLCEPAFSDAVKPLPDCVCVNSNCRRSFFSWKYILRLSFLVRFNCIYTGAPNGSVHQNICSSGKFLLAGRCGRNNSPWKESVAGKKIIQGVRGDLKSRIAAMGYLYGLLTTQDLNCTLWNFPVSKLQVVSAPCSAACWLGTLPSVLLGVRNR